MSLIESIIRILYWTVVIGGFCGMLAMTIYVIYTKISQKTESDKK